MNKVSFAAGGRALTLTNLDKPLWPDVGLTKADFLRYIAAVAPRMLPHLRGRPLTVVRFPDGVAAHGFYQKNAPPHTPHWVPTYEPPVPTGKKRPVRYVLAEEASTLFWLANDAAIEFHPWLSTTSQPTRPDYAVIDLDPGPGTGFNEARTVAHGAWELLQRLGLWAAPKTSGSTGIHIVIPLEPIYPYAVTSRFVGLLGRMLELSFPGLVTTERNVAKRPYGTVYVDHLQNLYGKTIVAVFSPRPTDRATVSAPFPWSRLACVNPEQFTVADPSSVLRYGEEYAAIVSRRQKLERALDLLRRSFSGI